MVATTIRERAVAVILRRPRPAVRPISRPPLVEAASRVAGRRMRLKNAAQCHSVHGPGPPDATAHQEILVLHHRRA